MAALVRVADDDGNPLARSVKFLSETKTEIDNGFLSPKPEDCPCFILVYEPNDDILSPAAQQLHAEVFVRASVYIVHHALQSTVAPKLMLDRIMFRMWDYLDYPTDDNPNGLTPSAVEGLTPAANHWEFDTSEMRRLTYQDVTEIRGERVVIRFDSATEQMWCRRVQLTPAQIIVNRPVVVT